MDMNRQVTKPISTVRSNRNHAVGVLTSLQAGRCMPIAAIPMLREDSMSGSIRIGFEMMETKELLMNPVNVRVTAYLVPLLALARFEGSRDMFDRSYMGQPKVAGGAVVPFIETVAAGTDGSNLIYKHLGLHAKSTDMVNTAYLEAYNQIWNMRARNRSPQIAERTRLQADLAPAFWPASRFEHVVPDFDQAVIDGEVALNLTNRIAVVKGLTFGAQTASGAQTNLRTGNASTGDLRVVSAYPYSGVPSVVAEMDAAGITVSLANIELAKKTQAFAKLREQYSEQTDAWIINMLMDGLTVPDQQLKQPMLLADQTARFSQAKRYATDAANLAEAAVSGAAFVDLAINVPRLSTGGVVMIIAEALPEQLFERQRDPFFHLDSVSKLPEYLRDTLDPEKVDVVLNADVDTDHATPTGVFGYAPMNWKWNSMGPRVGGKFFRPTTNTGTDTDRQRLWSIETVNPVLGADFYLSTTVHIKPFLNQSAQPFEASAVGNLVINGNTVFGGELVQQTGQYAAVLAKAPTVKVK